MAPVATLLASLLPALAVEAGVQGSGQERVPEPLGRDSSTSAATENSIRSGLEFLARAQALTGDGSFSVADAQPECYTPLGVSALCTLAFLASGSAPGRGPHGDVLTRAVDYLLLHTDLSAESKTRGYISAQGDKLSRTHGHGYATLALAEAYGTSSGSERIRTALVAAVERIQASQGAEGGWEYYPWPTSQHEGSVTICLVQALRAAHDAGIQVDAQVIRRAEDYVLRLQKQDGTFAYTLGDPRSSLALTAAGVATLNAAGRYDSAPIQNGIDALSSGLVLQRETGIPIEHPEYQRLYLSQALWQLSDTSVFRRWFAEERDLLLRAQDGDGGWKGSRFGSCYATAVNVLVLSLPDAALPIFQR